MSARVTACSDTARTSCTCSIAACFAGSGLPHALLPVAYHVPAHQQAAHAMLVDGKHQ